MPPAEREAITVRQDGDVAVAWLQAEMRDTRVNVVEAAIGGSSVDRRRSSHAAMANLNARRLPTALVSALNQHRWNAAPCGGLPRGQLDVGFDKCRMG